MTSVKSTSAAPDDRAPWKPQLRPDPRTGLPVHWLTQGDATTHHPYVYNVAFTRDERSIAICSDRTGSQQLYRYDLDKGEAYRLTDLENIVSLHTRVWTWQGRDEALIATPTLAAAVDMQTGRLRVLADVESLNDASGIPNGPVPSADGREVFIGYRQPDGRTVLAAIDGAGGEVRVLHTFDEHTERITHVNAVPGRPNLISYNSQPDLQEQWDLPADRRARVMLLDRATGQTRPLLVTPVGYRATHEYWSGDGTRLYYHLKTVPTWTPTWVCSLALDDPSQVVRHFSHDTSKLGHSSVSRDGRYMVIDNQEPGTNELNFVELATGRSAVICWPNASGRPHPNHVHPMFSPSGRFILYTSDEPGEAQVCLLHTADCIKLLG